MNYLDNWWVGQITDRPSACRVTQLSQQARKLTKKITLYFALSLKILAIFSHTHCCISFEFLFFLVRDRERGVLQTHWSADKPHESLSKCTLQRWTIYTTRRKKKKKWYTRLIPASTRYSHYKTKWGRKTRTSICILRTLYTAMEMTMHTVGWPLCYMMTCVALLGERAAIASSSVCCSPALMLISLSRHKSYRTGTMGNQHARHSLD